MTWLDEAYTFGFLATLAPGIRLYLVTGATYLGTAVADRVNDRRVRRLEGPRTQSSRTTGVLIGDVEYRAEQSKTRGQIAEWGTWDAQRGVYAVEIPEHVRRPYDDEPVRHYVWVKPPYVAAALKASPLTATFAALLLSVALGSIMWGGPHFGFPAGGLPEAIWDKYEVSVEEDLPDDPRVNQKFEDVTVLVPASSSAIRGYGEPVRGCTIDAGGGIETLTVMCPDERGQMSELVPFLDTPQEWFP